MKISATAAWRVSSNLASTTARVWVWHRRRRSPNEEYRSATAVAKNVIVVVVVVVSKESELWKKKHLGRQATKEDEEMKYEITHDENPSHWKKCAVVGVQKFVLQRFLACSVRARSPVVRKNDKILWERSSTHIKPMCDARTTSAFWYFPKKRDTKKERRGVVVCCISVDVDVSQSTLRVILVVANCNWSVLYWRLLDIWFEAE